MHTEDFSDGEDGYCVTSDLDGKEFILSQCFNLSTFGVGQAMRRMVEEMNAVPTIGVRYMMLQRGIEVEQMGMRLTGKTSAASAIVKREYGIKKGMSKKKTGHAFAILLQLATMLKKEGGWE
tara:strand:+ start:2321 stop:2686 length:366 start_codon:yes stop_codon:yes gene_type:complete